MAPVICALRAQPWADVRVVATAQHRQLADAVFRFFDIVPDVDLNLMQPDQTLNALFGRLMLAFNDVFPAETPDMVLAQGDTAGVFAAALAAFHLHIPFAHIEAGLRTHDLRRPFPEELYRQLTAKLTRLHFAPTAQARQNLLAEGVSDADIFVTGNTVIDALLYASTHAQVPEFLRNETRRIVLITAHRRENFGDPIENVCWAVRTLAQRHDDVVFVWPVHPNPNIKHMVETQLGRIPGVILCPPLEYGEFSALLRAAYLVLTDSGGVQEEAPSVNTPVLVLRNETDRPEALTTGAVRLVGCDPLLIVSTVETLLVDSQAYAAMTPGGWPYGDGTAAQSIVQTLESRL